MNRPHHPLIHLRHWTQPSIYELLNTLPFIRLGCVNVALGVGGDTVDGEELPWLSAAIPELGEDLQRLAVDHVHALVLAVGEVDVFLLGIAGEGDIPHRSI